MVLPIHMGNTPVLGSLTGHDARRRVIYSVDLKEYPLGVAGDGRIGASIPLFDKPRTPMLRSSPTMMLRTSIRRLPCVPRGTVAIGLVLLLLAIAPFAVAQDVHHELAAADHDGHEHSDTDLCQWVKHHTAGSFDVEAPLFTAQKLVDLLELPADSVLLSFELATLGPSRAPPCS